jgi:superoxide reductase
MSMAEKNQVYKCEVCGNIVEVLHEGAGELVCCGKPMILQNENTVDAAVEKHVPIIENKDGKILVKVGEVDHPMDEKHYIEWIEIIANGIVYRKNLASDNKPEAEFRIESENVIARAYCNLHGLWKSK